MKSRGLYNTIAMVENGNSLDDSLAMMPAKIVGYEWMSYRMPE